MSDCIYCQQERDLAESLRVDRAQHEQQEAQREQEARVTCLLVVLNCVYIPVSTCNTIIICSVSCLRI